MPFVLVAPHHQPATEEKILELCKRMQINYTVTAQGDVEGQNTLSLPIAFLFDHRGRCVETGRHISEKAIARAVKAAPAVTVEAKSGPGSILGEAEFEVLTEEAASIRGRRDLGTTLAHLRALVAADDDVEMDTRELEATMLLDSLETHATERLQHVLGQKEVRASAAIAALEAYAETWEGDELAQRAAEEAARLAGDEEFARWVKADEQLQELEQALAKLQPCKRSAPLDLDGCKACQKKNVGALRPVARRGASLIRKYADTPSAATARELLRAAGIRTR